MKRALEKSQKEQIIQNVRDLDISCLEFIEKHTCGLVECAKGLHHSQGITVIAIDEKTFQRSKPNERFNMQVNWISSTGRIAFHKSCWENHRSREKSLSKLEKKLTQISVETAEYYDEEKELNEKVNQAVEMIKNATNIISFTGAGVSVSAGIGTYRGTEGIDTKEELQVSKKSEKQQKEEISEESSDVDYVALNPTPTHLALVELEKMNKMKGVITQNCDGLHSKAGTSDDILYELHGNVFVEYCEKCEKSYKRDYCVDLYSTMCTKEKWYVKCSQCGHNHYTGRKCSKKNCKGKLRDTIINFGDYLLENVGGGLENATSICKNADLSLSIGSSLTVPPACKLPMMAKKMIICNLQTTEYDELATLRVFYPCDIFLTMVMNKLKTLNNEK